MTGTLVVAAMTDTGRKRSENQDSILAREVENGYLLAVADGVGGGPGGRRASEQTVAALEQEMAASADHDARTILGNAVSRANSAVLSIASHDARLNGMASTVTAALVRDGRAWIANVGDSRTYLLKDGLATAMTDDHSWVAEQVEAGRLSAEQAAADPRRNIITRAVGAENNLQVDLYSPVDLEDGDTLLLCSDGLYVVVDADEMVTICDENEPAAAVEALIALANERGGPDNISVVIGKWVAS